MFPMNNYFGLNFADIDKSTYLCRHINPTPKTIMQAIIDFLRQLSQNNNREWFMAHKSEYQQAQARFNELTEQLILGISQFDSSVSGLTAKDCTYRIYRDVRFSKDKSPYKTHMGAYVCPGGKKSGYAGYYFHVGTGMGEGYPYQHMLATGDYCYDPKVIQVLREDICYGKGDFDAIVREAATHHFSLDQDSMLRRVPNGFPADSPYADYLRLKSFCLLHTPDNAFITSPDVISRTVALFRTTYPFLQYINRAVEYVKEN